MKKPDLFWQKKCSQKKYSHCKCRKRKTTLAFSCGVPYLHFQLSKTHLVRFEDTRVSITSNPNTVSKLKRYLKMFLWLCLCFHKSTLLFAISVNTVVTVFSESHRLWEKQQVLIYYKSKDLLIAFFSQIFPPKKTFPHWFPPVWLLRTLRFSYTSYNGTCPPVWFHRFQILQVNLYSVHL